MIDNSGLLGQAFCGLPFLSDAFRSDLVTAMVRAKRRSALGDIGETDCLTPEYGWRYLESPETRPLHERWSRSADLSPSQIHRVDRTLGNLSKATEGWSQLFRIPIRFVAPQEPEVSSATHPCAPQTIALGSQAFDTDRALQAALIHEFAHVWFGLLSEIAQFDNGSDSRTFTLPTGTSGKTLRTVLFAAHFAVACGRYFGPKTRFVPGNESLTYHSYAEECLAVSANSPGLTAMGDYVWRELAAEVTRDSRGPTTVTRQSWTPQ
ncbi:hypothetical protein [Nocardia flavorosea]|uniref:hypothetical protein n=1 Tax=Nocardia flavorosea TaxID=53429 RepID=UPI0024562E30|nr:hypothetical protein [Nocardia flavorosea]